MYTFRKNVYLPKLEHERRMEGYKYESGQLRISLYTVILFSSLYSLDWLYLTKAKSLFFWPKMLLEDSL